MKKIFYIIISIYFIYNVAHSQNASTYFPTNLGYKWYYKNTPLDSLNNPQPALARFRVDSFAVVSNYNGLSANIVRLKDNLLTINQNTPYNDTNYHNFQGTNGFEYMNASLIPDTIGLPIGILNFFRGLQGWYNVLQFASNVGIQYTIVQKDTTVLVNTVTLHLRVRVTGKRLQDENISTVNGNYTAKKFLITTGIYAVVVIVEVPIVIRPDTTWIAPAVWMVKQTTPSVNMDLSALGYGNIPIPGQIYELTLPVSVRSISSEVPDKFVLNQNYPNPFNPNSKIKFSIKENSIVALKVYDILGKEVATLVNEKLQPGTYEVTFDGSKLSSGVYFYRLQAGDFIDTKKMILTK